ncbi:globin family protein [Gilvimarinus sp. SDUM040013]|uniref:Globin family protein n=1 Tax=Gilvimarinus gilvus TaxID=3058038 RepID=A0ABU4RY55_9GAMM|nr:globin family protein [Gilvimarinus sp. SDUM040013]MDO3386531.1 globin family protein [Gilvimarinus sp. SDUM040013]MDX6849107.1 globin family protein [Gilvimarinus sp. SDUM040013]
MALSTRQVTLIQDSFAQVEPIADTAADIFYKRLFELNPELRLMFKGDMKAQGKKLMTTLKVAVAGLDDIGKVVPVLKTLAERHVQYGVRPSDYTTVGNALLQTLKQGLGDAFTPEARQAWVELYRTIAQVMKAHAYPGFKG